MFDGLFDIDSSMIWGIIGGLAIGASIYGVVLLARLGKKLG